MTRTSTPPRLAHALTHAMSLRRSLLSGAATTLATVLLAAVPLGSALAQA